MDLSNLLQASIDLEKRIATDHALRKCFAQLWDQKSPASTSHTAPKIPAAPVQIRLSPDLAAWLQSASQATGKSPSQIVEEALNLLRHPQTAHKLPT